MNEDSQIAAAVNDPNVPIIEAKKKVVMQNDECQFLYSLLTKINPQDMNNAQVVWSLFQLIEDIVVAFEKKASSFKEEGEEVKKEFAQSNMPDAMREDGKEVKKMTQAEMDEKIDALNVKLRALHAEQIEFEAKPEMITVMIQMINALVASPGTDLSGRNNVRLLVGMHKALNDAVKS